MTDLKSNPSEVGANVQSALPLSVVFVVLSMHGGGAEFVARTWMAWLVKRGYRVSVVTTSSKATDEHIPDGVAVHRLGGARGHLAKARALREVFSTTGADIAVGLQAHANLLLLTAAMLAGSDAPKVIVSERNLVSLGLAGSGPRHRLKIWIAKKLYPRADHVIAISHPVGGELVAGFGVRGDRMTVVPNPATAKIAGRPPLPRQPGLDSGVQIVLPCRLVIQKRPTLAIETAAELNRRGIAAEVVSFGGGPLLEEMNRAAEAAGVTFTDRGWVEDWFAHFATNAVVLLPSSREGFGNVLVEAAAMGVPSVAASGALGVADAIVPGVTGELALTDAAADFADAVERASLLPVTGIDAWLTRFSVESSGRDLERVLHLVSGRGGSS
ncbi:glycosyltransferase family 4 protein [Microbacterium sp. BK668]|uniref:glycosyltransferase family 4 protein n=1 Tax=Microbacterium sp. BK668 TaxID=2512118 RepID=UPI00105DE30A|nr:glycosyltransferase family 4 protein [Microbacterium sp. BK668]TDN90544.1 glycosyltransferase involved in cell wall biosynthesis [Microbacterium sp. BK668]